MPNRKRHLLVGKRTRAACGLENPAHTTRVPAEVTCMGCRRTVLMADAEVAQQVAPRSNPTRSN